jgi:outer membrane lipoprotein SlyB
VYQFYIASTFFKETNMKTTSNKQTSMHWIKCGVSAVAFTAMSMAITGCANNPRQVDNGGSQITSAIGVVESIDIIRDSSGGSGAGAIVGGLVGGLLGNQVGSGNGRTAATVAGAVGGAVVGNNVEGNRNANGANDKVQVRVRLNSGESIVMVQNNLRNIRVGDRVRVENNQLYRY